MRTNSYNWSIETINLSKELHSKLTINNIDWHKKKGDPNIRAAELISGALIQLLQEGNPEDVKSMLKQGLLWLNQEIKDPGCPHH